MQPVQISYHCTELVFLIYFNTILFADLKISNENDISISLLIVIGLSVSKNVVKSENEALFNNTQLEEFYYSILSVADERGNFCFSTLGKFAM